MEVKKSPKADLENKKGLFLEIGLTLSLLICVAMFSWSQKEKVIEKFDTGAVEVEQEIVEITRQDQKPPEVQPAKTISVTSEVLKVVKNDTKITTTIDFTDFDEDITVEAAPVEEEIVEEEEIFLRAETMPSFQGGDLNAFRTWVQKRLKYPVIAHENNIQGRVVISFVVEKDGTLSQITALATPDKSLSEEAIRVISDSPKWTPGKQRGKSVRLKYTLPVDFRIN